MAATRHEPATERVSPMRGDVAALARQLGDAAGWTPDATDLLAPAQLPQTVAAFRAFLSDYRQRVLVARELPAIARAFEHARRGELRELLVLDKELSDVPVPDEFKRASEAVGRRQLHKLRPMRDHRLVQRYIAAVDEGHAHAWHALLFGVTLAVYSLPLRQGLLHFAQQTVLGFIHSAAPRLGLRNGKLAALASEACEGLPTATNEALAGVAPVAAALSR
jgi:urease accessory protein UreF